MISESILFLQDILKMHFSCLQVTNFDDFLWDIENAYHFLFAGPQFDTENVYLSLMPIL